MWCIVTIRLPTLTLPFVTYFAEPLKRGRGFTTMLSYPVASHGNYLALEYHDISGAIWRIATIRLTTPWSRDGFPIDDILLSLSLSVFLFIIYSCGHLCPSIFIFVASPPSFRFWSFFNFFFFFFFLVLPVVRLHSESHAHTSFRSKVLSASRYLRWSAILGVATYGRLLWSSWR